MKKILLTIMLVAVTLHGFAQLRSVSGRVTNASDNSPIAGATVMAISVAKTPFGVATDKDGNYKINLPQGATELSFTFIGMEKVVKKIGTSTTIDVQMQTAANLVEEVVVTALGIEREAKSLNYSRQGVDAESIVDSKSPDFVSALAGKVAGIQVNSAGQNTGSAGIVIRGSASATADNNAIFVIDGVIMENGAVGGERGGLDYGNAMGDINSEDIASIDVLKGPNATALYGSRASNGVIMITTKKSKGMGLKVSVGNNTTFQTISEFPGYQNVFGVGMDHSIASSNTMYTPNPLTSSRYRSWGPMMLGQPYIAIDGEERPYLPQPSNIKDFYKTAILTTTNVTVEGGQADNNIRLSYSNYYGNSIVEGVNDNKKHTFNINLFNRFTKWFELSTRVTYIKDDVENRQYTNSNNRNPVNTYVHMSRNTSLDELRQYKDENGNERATNRNASNPYWIINENPTVDSRDRLQSSVNAKLNLPLGITATGRLGIDYFWWNGTAMQNKGSIYDYAGRIDQFNENFKSTTVEGALNWKKRFKDVSILAMAGGSRNNRETDRRSQYVLDLVIPGYAHISNTTQPTTPVQSITKRATNSLYGSLSVGFKDYIYVDATVRNDWSSVLPAENCSYFYPSVGFSFIPTEAFKNALNSNIFSFMKLRFSYAKVGNDTAPYRIQDEYSLPGMFNGVPYAVIGATMNNSLLKPEITHSYEAGFEGRLFKDRLTFDVTWYRASTFNQIVPAFLTATSGYTKRIFNTGEIRNSGWEISASIVPVKTKSFMWRSQVNWSVNNSLVVSLLEDYGVNSLTLYSTSNTSVNVEVGKPYGYIRGVGVARTPDGRMIMADGLGEFEMIPDMGFGSNSPKWSAGWSNEFSWKGISASVLIDARIGGIIYCNTYSKMMTNGMTTENLDQRIGQYLSSVIYNENDSEITHGIQWKNAVQREYDANGNVIGYKPVTKFFSPSGYEYTRSSINEFSVFDASYVKLREFKVGYSIPSRILKKTPLSSLRFSFVARNPWTIYKNTPQGVDPESAATTGNGRGIENGSLPPIATYGFDIRFSFN